MAKMTIPGLTAEVEPIVAGVYPVRVESLAQGFSSTQKPMYKLRMTIIQDGPYMGRALFDNFVIDADVPVGRRRLAGLLKTAGIAVAGDSFDTSDIEGVQLRVSVEPEEDPRNPGEMLDRVRRYFPAE